MVWLWYPETVGKTLEEVEDVFRDGNLTSRVTRVANGLTPRNSGCEEASVSPAGGPVQETKGAV